MGGVEGCPIVGQGGVPDPWAGERTLHLRKRVARRRPAGRPAPPEVVQERPVIRFEQHLRKATLLEEEDVPGPGQLVEVARQGRTKPAGVRHGQGGQRGDPVRRAGGGDVADAGAPVVTDQVGAGFPERVDPGDHVLAEGGQAVVAVGRLGRRLIAAQGHGHRPIAGGRKVWQQPPPGRRGVGKAVQTQNQRPLAQRIRREGQVAGLERQAVGAVDHPAQAQGSIRILACRSGSARSANAWVTPSSPTLPVISARQSRAPSPIRARASANSAGV